MGLKVPDLHWVGWPMNWEQATVTGLGAKGLLAHSHDGAVTRCPLLLFLACITRYALLGRRFENEAKTVSGSPATRTYVDFRVLRE